MSPPNAPSNVVAKRLSSQQILLSWESDEADPDVFYTVYYDEGSGTEPSVELMTTEDLYYVFDTSNPAVFKFKITQTTAIGQSEPSAVVSASTLKSSVKVSYSLNPNKLVANFNFDEVNAELQERGKKNVSYLFFRRLRRRQLEAVEGDVKSLELELGTPYQLEIQAVLDEKIVPIQEPISINMGKPSEPLYLRSDPDSTSVILRWQPPKSSGGLPLLGYQVYMQVGLNKDEYVLVANTTSRTFEMREFAHSEFLSYKVLAYNQLGAGEFSNEITVWKEHPMFSPEYDLMLHSEEVSRSWLAFIIVFVVLLAVLAVVGVYISRMRQKGKVQSVQLELPSTRIETERPMQTETSDQ